MGSLVLVAYASKHGSTRGIAEWIGESIRGFGHEVEVRPVKEVADLSRYDAFVIGSAAYMGFWLKDAREFVRRHAGLLAERPVWLFSSGPLGTETHDAQGNDVLVSCEPREFLEFKSSVRPKEMKVFFGALDPKHLDFSARLLRRTAAGAKMLPVGDFRDHPAVEEWGAAIGRELAQVPASV